MIVNNDFVTFGTSYEEAYLGLDFYIEPNPDRWRGGFFWLVCKDGEEIDSGLCYSIEDAILDAKKVIAVVNRN